MNNDTLDLNQYAALQEGPYQDCTLLRISPLMVPITLWNI